MCYCGACFDGCVWLGVNLKKRNKRKAQVDMGDELFGC